MHAGLVEKTDAFSHFTILLNTKLAGYEHLQPSHYGASIVFSETLLRDYV